MNIKDAKNEIIHTLAAYLKKDGQAVRLVRPKCFLIKWTLLIPNIKTNLLFRP